MKHPASNHQCMSVLAESTGKIIVFQSFFNGNHGFSMGFQGFQPQMEASTLFQLPIPQFAGPTRETAVIGSRSSSSSVNSTSTARNQAPLKKARIVSWATTEPPVEFDRKKCFPQVMAFKDVQFFFGYLERVIFAKANECGVSWEGSGVGTKISSKKTLVWNSKGTARHRGDAQLCIDLCEYVHI